jgi:hypothetical protein
MSLAALIFSACLAGVWLTDDFSLPGAPQADRWRVVAGTWQCGQGRVRAGLEGQGWLVWRGLIPPQRLRVEVELTPRQGQVPGQWGAAGVAAYLDSAHYWRLALVENATDKTNRYFELVEMYDGQWQAQSVGATACKVLDESANAAWDYGRTYRFRLSLDGQRCSGEVFAGEQRLWWRVYELAEEGAAVRSGWPALTTNFLAADFADLRAEAELVQVPVRSGPPVVCLVHNDLPGSDPAEEAWARQALSEAGLRVEALAAAELPSALAAADCDLLVIPSAHVVPVGTGPALDRFLQRGGNLMVLSAEQPFRQQLVRVGERWMTPQEAQATVPPRAILVGWRPEEVEHLEYATSNAAHTAVVTTEPIDEQRGGRALHVRLSGCDGWVHWTARVAAGSLRVDVPVLLFWAKGGASTKHLVIEADEDDESRWITAVPLAQEWQPYPLAPEAFQFWPDCPARGRRGLPGDSLCPDHVIAVRVGLAHSHAPLPKGPAEFWVSALMAAPRLEAAKPQRAALPHLEALTPAYKTFAYSGALELATAAETAWPLARWSWQGQLRCVYPRPWGRVVTGVRGRRWIGLLEARHAAGYCAYPAALYIPAEGPYAGASWSFWGLPSAAWQAGGLAARRLLAAVAEAQCRRVWILEAGPDQVAYLPSQRPRWGATLVNKTSQPARVVIKGRLLEEASGRQRQLGELVRTVTVPPLGEVTVLEPWAPPRPGLYRATVSAFLSGRQSDVVSTVFRVLDGRADAAREYVRVQEGRFVVNGRPWFPHGVNFWPRYVAGMGTADYWTGWQHRAHYDPLLVEEDLQIAQSLGITALSIQAPRSVEDLPCLWDFLARCKAHHIRVNLYLPVDPRGFDAEFVRALVTQGHLANFSALFAYDITWEPRWGHYAERKRFDPQWREWVIDQYGSVAAAEKAWGFAAPRDEEGQLTGPADEQLTTDGPWRVFVAAYRRFVDDFLSAGYGRSCRFLRRLDPYHLISNRAGWGGTANLHTVACYQFDPLSGAAHLDFLSPEAYGMRPEEGDFKRWGFVDAYCRWAGNGKPVFWSEYGASLYEFQAPEAYEQQRRIWENVQRLVVFADGDGDAGWWWPGGYRVDERSDFGCVEPWGQPRPAALELKKWAPAICGRGKRQPPARWLVIDRDSDVRGPAGLWVRHLDAYLAQAPMALRTAGDGKTSLDVPLVGVGNIAYTGVGPVKYLNAELTGVVAEVAGKQYRPADDLLWGEIVLPLPAGQRGRLRLELLNTGEATWIRTQTAGGRPGAVRLWDLSSGRPLADLSADTPRYHTATADFDFTAPPAGQQVRLTLQLEAAGRCRFGQKIKLLLHGQ